MKLIFFEMNLSEKKQKVCFLIQWPSIGLIVGLLCLLPGAPNVLAQWTMGGHTVAMAGAHTALPSDDWSVFHNPALIDQKERLFGVFAIRYYGLSELEDHAALLSLPLGNFLGGNRFSTATAAGFHSYGFELYRKTQMRTGWAFRFDRFRLGMSASYIHKRIEGYGSAGSPVFDAGLAVNLSEGFRIGYRITHLFQTPTQPGEIALHSSEMSGGISWQGISGLIIATDVVKDVLHPVSLRSAFQVEITEGFYLRAGFISRPFIWSAGAGFRISGFRINPAVQKHYVLGFSPGIDCIFSF